MRYIMASMFGFGLTYHNTVESILVLLAYALTDILTIIGAITVIRWWLNRRKP